MKRIIIAAALALLPNLAFAQGAVLQGGAWVPGHVPQYVMTGNSQAIVIDGGAASGGPIGTNIGEIGVVARGTGIAPYVGQGTGPLGTIDCLYDAPTNNATGYHYLCMSPNAMGGGLLAYGAGGAASTLPLSFYINGSTYSFPFVTSGIVGPSTSVVNDAACWNNTVGTLLKDCGAFVTVGGNNTWTGTNNYTGPFQINGAAQTFPASGNILGNSDTQTITNKSIGASQINSGTLSAVVFPALTGAVTNSAGSLVTTLSAASVANSNLIAGAANTIKGSINGTTEADLAAPSCSSANQALQWVTGTGLQCATVSASTAGFGINLSAGVFSISTVQPPYGFDQPVNLGLSSAAVGSNLTITLTGANGSTASATNPVSIPFRSGTLTTGVPVWGIVTGALSLVIPSGATLGTSSSNVPFRVWLFASYNAGTVQLGAAVCSSATQIFPCASWEYNRITSTTISGLATSSGVLYATAGVSNDPVRIIGYCDYASGLGTAGSWATACTTLQLFGPGIKKPGDVVQSVYASSGTAASTATTYALSSTLPTTANGALAVSAPSFTAGATPNLVRVTGNVFGSVSASNGTMVGYMANGTTVLAISGSTSGTGTNAMSNPIVYEGLVSNTAATYSLYVIGTASSSSNAINGTTAALWTGVPISKILVEEIMGSLEPDNDNAPLSMVG